MIAEKNNNNKEKTGAFARKLGTRRDIAMIIALLIIAGLVYFRQTARQISEGNVKPYCEVVLDGEPMMTAYLDKNQTFSLEQKPNVIFEVKDGNIAFIASDCPDKICILSGYLHQPGQTAACLPNRIAIRIITDNDKDTPDMVM